MHLRHLLGQLIVSFRKTGRTPLPPGTREQLQEAIEIAVIIHHELRLYNARLSELLEPADDTRRDEWGTDKNLSDLMKQIIEHGLGILSDDELGRFAIDPLAVGSLYTMLQQIFNPGGPEELQRMMELIQEGNLEAVITQAELNEFPARIQGFDTDRIRESWHPRLLAELNLKRDTLKSLGF